MGIGVLPNGAQSTLLPRIQQVPPPPPSTPIHPPHLISSHPSPPLSLYFQEDLKKVDPRMDWTVNSDGSRSPDGRACRAAAEDFSQEVGRQLTITYKDETNTNFPTYYMRK